MKISCCLITLLITASTVLTTGLASDTDKPEAEFPVHLQKNGLVVIEAESTTSDPGKWVEESEIPGFGGEGYLRFTGNSHINGPPDSPIVFAFRINRDGLHHLHLHCARETIDGRKDVANDAYIRVEGPYQSADGPHDSHGDPASLEALRTDNKYYGGDDLSFAWVSGNRLDLGGHQNKRVPLYDFKANETYTLVVSGRSRQFRLDRIVFRHESVSRQVAEDVNQPVSPADGFEPDTCKKTTGNGQR